jgi:hypothetical protein
LNPWTPSHPTSIGVVEVPAMWTPEIFVDRTSTDVEGPFLKVEGAVTELWPVGRAVSNEGDEIERTG